MNYTLARNDQQLGQFTEEQIRAGLLDGTYLPTDLAWREGMANWKTLGEVFAPRMATPPPVPQNVVLPPLAPKKSNGCVIAAIVAGVLFVGLIFVAILAALAIPVYTTVVEKGNVVKEVNCAKQLVLACKTYASDHNGNYPKTLDELVSSGVLTQESFKQLTAFKVPSWRGEPGFDYFGAGMKANDDGNKVLLQSKASSPTGHRIQALNDGSVSKTKGDQLTPPR